MSAIARSASFSRFVSLLERVTAERRNLLGVLTYHRVDEIDAQPDLDPKLISATPASFDEQMRFLAQRYRVLAMSDVLDACRVGKALPARSILITFDDAYCDFATHAWPILKRYGLPASMFVPTAYPDRPDRAFWWDRVHQAVNDAPSAAHLRAPLRRLGLTAISDRESTLRRLKRYLKSLRHAELVLAVDTLCAELGCDTSTHHVLSWEQLRTLADEGLTLGAHTRTHPRMTRVSPTEAESEAVESRRDLEREIGSVLPVFAYPDGAVDDEVTRRLAREGFELGFTTSRGMNDMAKADKLRLRRINVGRLTTQPVLRAQLLPLALHMNRWFCTSYD